MSEVGKEGRYDSFFAGLLGGYAVFGRNSGSVSQQVRRALFQTRRDKNGADLPFQIVIYVFARVMLSLAKLAIEPKANPLSTMIPPETRTRISNNTYPIFASVSWALVMYIFRWYPETLISSLRSSMVYMYDYVYGSWLSACFANT